MRRTHPFIKYFLLSIASIGLAITAHGAGPPSHQDCGLTTDPVTGLLTRLPGTEPSVVQQAQMRDRRYGMFIHFGINTFANLEWSDGTVPAATYAPKEIAADEWVLAAKNAGMSHVVLITKHHDGFCLWPTKFTVYSVANSGNKTDVVKAVSDACKRHGMNFAIYYSLWDRNWDARHAEDYKKDRAATNKAYTDYMVNQLGELLTQYGPAVELWLDGQWAKSHPEWDFPRVYDAVKRRQPACQIAVNHTICLPGKTPRREDWSAYCKPWEQKEGYPIAPFPSDFRLWDPYLPGPNDPKVFTYDGKSYYMPFESTVCMNKDWFWHEADKALKSTDELEALYLQATGQNNLLLLNCPPDTTGHMRADNVRRLIELRDRLGIKVGGPFPTNMSVGANASASSTWSQQTGYDAAKAIDEDPNSRWASEANIFDLTQTFPAPRRVNRVLLREYLENGKGRIGRFVLEAEVNGKWIILAEGTGVGVSKRFDFAAVDVTALRLRILDASGPPSIYSFLAFLAPADSSSSTAPAAIDSAVRPAQALIARVLPQHANHITCEIIPADNGKNVFEIESVNGKIILRGDNGVSLASALGHYLKYTCHCDFSWCGTQMAVPKALPPVDAKIRCVTPHKYRTFFNYCTFGYSMPWWTWKEWERAVDQLAMQGYNMPLAMTGMEGIWYHTLLRFGFSDVEARSFLSAPCHLPWQLMQNLEGADGPLPKSWIDSHIELGRKIIQRERELGMTPIQQGFSGHVPHLFKTKFPAASIAVQPGWCNFPGVAQLDPLDPLFEKFGAAFIEEEIRLYGTNHLYAADPFHESAPPKPGNEYLSAVGKNIFSVMTKVDPKAMWIMQGWTNHRPIVEAVPKDRMLIMAIGGNSNGAYWGYPFLNCRYNNFGCRSNMHGDLKALATNPFAATVNAPNSNCHGTGLMMEGFYQNPVYLQMNSDLIWRNGPVDATHWLHDYARRRYGAESAAANQAWDLLLTGPYAPGTPDTEFSSIIAGRPALQCKKAGPNEGMAIPYDPMLLVSAWKLLLQDRDQLKASDGYRFDIADVTRQALSNLGQTLQRQVTCAHFAKDKPAFDQATRDFLELLDDVDGICGTRPEYHFGKWVADARKWGTSSEEKDFYERNASTLVTLWGPVNDPQIFDYAWREWSGLIKSFYRGRWEMFFAHLAANPDYRDSGPQVYGRETFRANAFYQKLADWEVAWTKQPHNLPAQPAGDTVEISAKLLEKYLPVCEKVLSPEFQKQLADSMAEAMAGLPANATRIGQWKTGDIPPSGKEISLDVSKTMTDEGDYEITFTYLSGWQRLDIEWVALTLNGTEIMRDTHAGTAGKPSTANTYKLNPGTMAFNSRYEIRAKVKTTNTSDSNGVITLKKINR